MGQHQLDIGTRIQLNNGTEMPQFGFGTFLADNGGEAKRSVLYAVSQGYRLIDTASQYGNESDVGEAVVECGLPRDELFVTTKLWNDDHGYDSTLNSCRESLEELNLSFVDLYLVHWPVEVLRNETWKAMEQLLGEGKAKAIGVSNYTIGHLEELLDEHSVVPAVNQVEFHPWLYQKELMEFCNKNNIQLEAYASLTKGKRFDEPELQELVNKYERTPAQLLLRWALQHGVIVIPKSAREERIEENRDVFDFHISGKDMALMDSFNEDYRTSWDPTDVP